MDSKQRQGPETGDVRALTPLVTALSNMGRAVPYTSGIRIIVLLLRCTHLSSLVSIDRSGSSRQDALPALHVL